MTDDKKVIHAGIKYIWSNNHPNVIEILKSSYVSLNDALKMYGNFFDRVISIRNLFYRETNFLLKTRNPHLLKKIENNEIDPEQGNKEIEENKKIIEKYNRYYEMANKLLVIFPIRFANGETLISEHINGYNDSDVMYYHNQELYQNSVMGQYKLLNANSEEIIDVDTDDDIKASQELDDLLFERCKIDIASLPSYLSNNNLFEDDKQFEQDYNFVMSEIGKMMEKNQQILIQNKMIDERKFADQRVEIRRQEEEARKQKIEEIKNKLFLTLTSLNDLVDESKSKIVKYPISEEILFNVDENGVKTIDERFIPNLKFIDLTNISFDNVDLRGIDFSDCNPLIIDPQKVFNKDLSNTIFIDDNSRVNNSFPFNASTNFEGVNLCGATIDINSPVIISFNGAITDETTTIKIGEKIIETTNIMNR